MLRTVAPWFFRSASCKREPIDRIEPELPTLRIEPALPMLRIEPALAVLNSDAALSALAKLRTLSTE